MIPLVVDIQTPGSRLRCHRGHLVVSANDNESKLPLSDIGVLLFSTPGFQITGNLVSRLSAQGTQIIFCGEDFLPASQLYNQVTAAEAERRLFAQIEASAPLKKRLWKSIVRAKIQGQAEVLDAFGLAREPVSLFINKVRSGDSENVEAQASRRYWPLLFGDGFRRRREVDDGINPLLNYGYTVLRGFTARAIAAVGLNPLLSLHHSAGSNALALVDDVMEPFRPFIDYQVKTLVNNDLAFLCPDSKKALVEVFSYDIEKEGERTTLPNMLISYTRSLLLSLQEKKDCLLCIGFFMDEMDKRE